MLGFTEHRQRVPSDKQKDAVHNDDSHETCFQKTSELWTNVLGERTKSLDEAGNRYARERRVQLEPITHISMEGWTG